MLLEDSYKNIDKYKDKENTILIGCSRYYPRWVKKNTMDFAPELAPIIEYVDKYKDMKDKMLNIMYSQRAWGSTEDEKRINAKTHAFTVVFGANAVVYRRYLQNNLDAVKRITEIREYLNQSKDVVLLCFETEPPCHRYILMQVILRKRSMSRMFQTLEYPKYPYQVFANRLEGRYYRMRPRVI